VLLEVVPHGTCCEEKKSRNRGGMNGSSMDGDPTDKRIGRWDEIINGENERCRKYCRV
jgi:hypothetical protein